MQKLQIFSQSLLFSTCPNIIDDFSKIDVDENEFIYRIKLFIQSACILALLAALDKKVFVYYNTLPDSVFE